MVVGRDLFFWPSLGHSKLEGRMGKKHSRSDRSSCLKSVQYCAIKLSRKTESLNFPQFLYNVMRRCSFNPFQSKFSYQSRTNIFWRQI
ncbi:hypothetical protein BLOT_002773, partial [Blomia tropicalis]